MVITAAKAFKNQKEKEIQMIVPDAIAPNSVYLDQRLGTLGISHDMVTFERVWHQPASTKGEDGKITTRDTEHRRNYQLFDHDEDGNIVIHYFNLLGQPYRWRKEETKQTRDFIRKRLCKPQHENFKYWQEKGSPQFPFFTPRIISKYKRCKESVNIDGSAVDPIATLFLVEGEFKAFKGALADLDIVGLPSIHGFYNGDVKGKIHEDIQELIITCQVKKIVLLYDADVLIVNYKEENDLSKRPSSFYGAIKAFRESLQLLLDDKEVRLECVFFMHIESKYLKDGKGLDDLLANYSACTTEIIEDLHKLAFANKYFHGVSILDQIKDVHSKLYRYLGLNDEQEFYKTYQPFIESREFEFKRRRYVYDNEKKEVVYVRHKDADKFMRIGPDWVKEIVRINKYGEEERELRRWSIAEIKRDYQKFPDFTEQIMKYDDYCNEPNWTSQYKRVHKNCYNLCEPLMWSAQPGSVRNTIKFLKHIFQGIADVQLNSDGTVANESCVIGDPFTVALDYLSILLTNPKHMLPVPILVSQENGTGKSTFLKWLQLLFGANMCILGNEQFKMKFNSHYISKFIIAVDEGFLEVDKKSEKERLKQLVTADSAYLESKGMDVRKINYYGKLIICSNDADRVMKIDEGESRWFVVKVPIIPKIKLRGIDLKNRGYNTFRGEQIVDDIVYEVPDVDPDLETKLKEEMPALIHFLRDRKIHHPRVNRLWFDPEWFITEQFKLIVETTKNRIDRVFEDWLRDQFLTYDHSTLEYTLKYLTEQLNDGKVSKYKIDTVELKKYLKEKGLVPGKPKWHKMPVGFSTQGVVDERGVIVDPGANLDNVPKKIEYKPNTGRTFLFKREDWISSEELLGDFVRNDPPEPDPGERVKTAKSAQNERLPF